MISITWPHTPSIRARASHRTQQNMQRRSRSYASSRPTSRITLPWTKARTSILGEWTKTRRWRLTTRSLVQAVELRQRKSFGPNSRTEETETSISEFVCSTRQLYLLARAPLRTRQTWLLKTKVRMQHVIGDGVWTPRSPINADNINPD